MLCGQCFCEMSGQGVCPVCGFDNAQQRQKYPVALRPGSILNGRYIVGRVLGQGGFGITYLAQDDRSRSRVAIKEYYPAEFAGRSPDATSIQVLSGNREEDFNYGKEQFLAEAKTLAEVSGNAHIVQIFSYFEENGTAYFVMEYVEGLPLNTWLKQHGALSPQAADALLLPLMEALGWVHGKGIVHRDIAPDNIIVTKDRTAKLIDFGAARYSTGEKSKSLDVILKHGFAPKEQYTRRGRQGAWTDVYAMAATYYYAVTGRIPPDAIDRIEQDDLIPPSTLGAKLSPAAEEALLKGLEINAQDRWQSMADFAAAMRGKMPSEKEAERRAREAAEKAEAARRAREAAEKAEAERRAREAAQALSSKPAKKRSPLPFILAAAAILTLVVVAVIGLSGRNPAASVPTVTTAAPVLTAVPDLTAAPEAERAPLPAEPAAKPSVLVVGTCADYFPYEFMVPDDSGNLVYAGIDISVAGYVADSLGMELQVKNLEFESLLPALQAGNCDMVIAALLPSEERKSMVDFSDTYQNENEDSYVLLVREDDADFYSSTASFAGAKIGAVSTSMAMETLVNSMPEAVPVPFSGSGDVVTSLALGVVDAAIVRRDAADSYLETLPDLAVSAVLPGQSGNMCIAVAKDDPIGLLPGINAAIARMHTSGALTGFIDEANSLGDKAQEVSGS